MSEQLELFSTLPLVLQPPRRLRRLGLELEQIEHDVAVLVDIRRQLDRDEATLAATVAEAQTIGYVLPNAYRVVVKAEDVRERADEKLRDAHELYRALERQLDRGINSYLRRASKMGASAMRVVK